LKQVHFEEPNSNVRQQNESKMLLVFVLATSGTNYHHHQPCSKFRCHTTSQCSAGSRAAEPAFDVLLSSNLVISAPDSSRRAMRALWTAAAAERYRWSSRTSGNRARLDRNSIQELSFGRRRRASFPQFRQPRRHAVVNDVNIWNTTNTRKASVRRAVMPGRRADRATPRKRGNYVVYRPPTSLLREKIYTHAKSVVAWWLWRPLMVCIMAFL